MGSAASTGEVKVGSQSRTSTAITRLRKALVIRAYNLRKKDETLYQQFREYAYPVDNKLGPSSGKALYIKIDDIKSCLQFTGDSVTSDAALGSSWVDDLFKYTIGASMKEMNFVEFLQFLEVGKIPSLGRNGKDRSEEYSSANKGVVLTDINRIGAIGKNPPSAGPRDKIVSQTSPREVYNILPHPPNNQYTSELDYEVRSLQTDASPLDDQEEKVLRINLSTKELPETVKFIDSDLVNEQETTTILVRSTSSRSLGFNGDSDQVRPLWRKREVVRNEKTVHYTTMDEDGALQELCEKETTQTEVLHMECRETGEFAHRETTKFEQVEEFNNDVVGTVEGTEEYVHLKSLEDEFHYMDSTMPKKEEPDASPNPNAQRHTEANNDDAEHNQEDASTYVKMNLSTEDEEIKSPLQSPMFDENKSYVMGSPQSELNVSLSDGEGKKKDIQPSGENIVDIEQTLSVEKDVKGKENHINIDVDFGDITSDTEYVTKPTSVSPELFKGVEMTRTDSYQSLHSID